MKNLLVILLDRNNFAKVFAKRLSIVGSSVENIVKNVIQIAKINSIMNTEVITIRHRLVLLKQKKKKNF